MNLRPTFIFCSLPYKTKPSKRVNLNQRQWSVGPVLCRFCVVNPRALPAGLTFKQAGRLPYRVPPQPKPCSQSTECESSGFGNSPSSSLPPWPWQLQGRTDLSGEDLVWTRTRTRWWSWTRGQPARMKTPWVWGEDLSTGGKPNLLSFFLKQIVSDDTWSIGISRIFIKSLIVATIHWAMWTLTTGKTGRAGEKTVLYSL